MQPSVDFHRAALCGDPAEEIERVVQRFGAEELHRALPCEEERGGGVRAVRPFVRDLLKLLLRAQVVVVPEENLAELHPHLVEHGGLWIFRDEIARSCDGLVIAFRSVYPVARHLRVREENAEIVRLLAHFRSRVRGGCDFLLELLRLGGIAIVQRDVRECELRLGAARVGIEAGEKSVQRCACVHIALPRAGETLLEPQVAGERGIGELHGEGHKLLGEARVVFLKQPRERRVVARADFQRGRARRRIQKAGGCADEFALLKIEQRGLERDYAAQFLRLRSARGCIEIRLRAREIVPRLGILRERRVRIRREAVLGKLREEFFQRGVRRLGAFRALVDACEVKLRERRGLRRKLRGHARQRAFVRAAVALVNLIEPAKNRRGLRARRILPDERFEHLLRSLRPACCEAGVRLRERRRRAEILRDTSRRRGISRRDEWREIVERSERLLLVKVDARLDVSPPVFIGGRPRRGIEQGARFCHAAEIHEQRGKPEPECGLRGF